MTYKYNGAKPERPARTDRPAPTYTPPPNQPQNYEVLRVPTRATRHRGYNPRQQLAELTVPRVAAYASIPIGEAFRWTDIFRRLTRGWTDGHQQIYNLLVVDAARRNRGDPAAARPLALRTLENASLTEHVRAHYIDTPRPDAGMARSWCLLDDPAAADYARALEGRQSGPAYARYNLHEYDIELLGFVDDRSELHPVFHAVGAQALAGAAQSLSA